MRTLSVCAALGRWLALCLLAWLTAHALATGARLLWPGTGLTPEAAAVDIDSAALPVVPAQWSTQAAPVARQIPITDLPYSVVGRALSTTRSLVVLKTPQGQRALMPGDSVEAGIEIARIDADGVVLSRDGRLERLPWPSPTTASEGAITPSAAATRDSPASTASSPPLLESSS